jgi:hypothetical protein
MSSTVSAEAERATVTGVAFSESFIRCSVFTCAIRFPLLACAFRLLACLLPQIMCCFLHNIEAVTAELTSAFHCCY